MGKETITTRSAVYRDEALGDLIYDADFASIERTEERIIIKVRLDKLLNWLELSDMLWNAMHWLTQWAWKKMKEDADMKFADIPIIVRNEMLERQRDEMLTSGDDQFLFTYFYSEYNWVMYENENEYLFLYEMEIKDMYELGITSQIEALHFWPQDDLGALSDFLHSWFYRVNGYPADEEEYDENCS